MQVKLDDAPEMVLREVASVNASRRWCHRFWCCNHVADLSGPGSLLLGQMTEELVALKTTEEAKNIYQQTQVDLRNGINHQMDQVLGVIARYKVNAELPQDYLDALVNVEHNLTQARNNDQQPLMVRMEVEAESQGGNNSYQSY
jgi:hypothetical protein